MSRNHFGLVLEPLAEIGIVGDMRQEHLDGDRTVQAGITGLIDFSHSACTQRRENLVRPELRTSLKRHKPILETQL